MKRNLRMGAVAGVCALGGAAAAVAWGRAEPTGAAPPGLPPATAAVTKATLVDRTEVDGTLGHGPATAVDARGGGTLTWLPAEGAVVERGGALYKVDELPVTLLHGALPAYRRLSVGSEGADVEQLEENLAALGYRGFTVDEDYTASTAAAVREWQGDLGRERTGAVEPGHVAYAAAPVRVAALDARVGGRAEGPVLRHTGTTRSVRVALPVGLQRLAVVGAAVEVALPDDRRVAGSVERVGAVATAAKEEGGEATIELTVSVGDQGALGALDQAPVEVALVSEERAGVLTAPVAALLALREGGYGLEVVEGGTARTVPVRVGMFADGRVEVSGEGIAEGTIVGMPA